MRRLTRMAIVTTTAALLTACSIHPLPEQVTGKTSLQIANAIRCETRTAIRHKFADILKHSDYERSRQLGRQLAAGMVLQEGLEFLVDDPDIVRIMRSFYNVGIGYAFTFDVEENNNNGSGLKFTLPFTGGTFSLDLTGQKDLKRKNRRDFTIVDRVEALATNQNVCRNVTDVDRNFIYPITGEVGMDEVVRTFYDFVVMVDELEKDDRENTYKFVEKLTFTTKISGTIAPKVVLDSAPNDFRLTEASVTSTHDRTDIHEVIVAFRPPGTGLDALSDRDLKRRIFDDIERERDRDSVGFFR